MRDFNSPMVSDSKFKHIAMPYNSNKERWVFRILKKFKIRSTMEGLFLVEYERFQFADGNRFKFSKKIFKKV